MGLMPELGSTRILAELVGLGNATDMCLTGRMVPADEALKMGLVTQVTEPEALMDTAMAKAEEIANNPTNAVMMIKELLRKNPLDPDLEADDRSQVVLGQRRRSTINSRRTADHRAAVDRMTTAFEQETVYASA